jgi:hypothetical protein
VSLGPGLLTEVASGLGPDLPALDAITAAGSPAPPAERLERRSLVAPLLLLACALLLVEIAARRLR